WTLARALPPHNCGHATVVEGSLAAKRQPCCPIYLQALARKSACRSGAFQFGAWPVAGVRSGLIGALQEIVYGRRGIGKPPHVVVREKKFSEGRAVRRLARLDPCRREAG